MTGNINQPAFYPVNDTSLSEGERGHLQKLTNQQQNQDLSEDLRGYVRDISIGFTVFAAVFVLLRFLARYRQAARIGIDDWLMVFALLILVGNMVMNIMLTHQGLGLHSGALTLPELQTLDQTVVGAEIIYVTGVNMYKLSLLFLYFRIFPLRQVRIGGYICGGISTAWNIACILAATFQCTPRERLWMPWLDGTCINLFLTQLCISIPSILCDIAILALPIPHVMRLNTNLTQRVLISFIFLLGSYVVFTSIYRFFVFLRYTPNDVPYTLADGCAWNVIEISSGIVSACLPTLGPLVRDIFKSVLPTGALSSGKAGQSNNSALVTIGGTGGQKNGAGVGLSSKGSKWNRLPGESETGSASREDAKYGIHETGSIEDDIELVPKHRMGHVKVTVRANHGPNGVHGHGERPDGAGVPRKSSDRGNRRRGDSDDNRSEGTGDEYPLTAIRQRREFEWTVEEANPRHMDGGKESL